jgi:hypothetical protein
MRWRAAVATVVLGVTGLALAVLELSDVPLTGAQEQMTPEQPPSTPKPASETPGFTPIVIITGDKGGDIGAYAAKYRALAEDGAIFRIDGRCVSACTIVLAYADRVCVTKRAALGFHEARDRSGKRLQAGSDYMMSSYPAPVREYISAHGGLPPPYGVMWVTGSALRGLVKPCG